MTTKGIHTTRYAGRNHRVRRTPARTGADGIQLIAWLGFLGLFAAVARTDVDPRVANPNVEGRPRPVES